MKLFKTFVALVGSAALISGLLAENARAQAVTGSIGFHGGATITQGGGTSTFTFGNPWSVEIRTGDYSGIPMGTAANFAPISWSGSGTSAVLTSNNSPEWTINFGGTTYQFSIISLSSATTALVMGQPAVSIIGTGIATIGGAINRQPTYITFAVQGIRNEFVFEQIQSCAGGCGPPRLVPDGGSTILLLALSVVASLQLRRRWLTVA